MKVSIITVTYNSEETVEDTIKSVLSQSYKNLEYIIIDGKSQDSTLDIVEKYSAQISKVVSEKDQGMYDALNKGIELASGDLIGILNSDDLYIDSDVIQDVVNQISSTDSDALYADLVYVERYNLDQIKRYWQSGSYKHGAFLWGWMPPHPTFFVKKSAYQLYGKFNVSLKSAADYELMLRFIHKHKLKMTYLQRILVKMREGGMSNESLVNRLKANKQDRHAWRINDLRPYPFTLWLKPLRKIGQFLGIKKAP